MSPPRGAPRLLRRLAEILLPAADREFIVGDLEELYLLREAKGGRLHAGWRYLRELIGSVGPRRLRRGDPGGKRRLTDPRRRGVLGNLSSDLRSALRTLSRERGFAALTILTLALGVGSTATVFGMVDQLLLRPLPGVSDAGGAAYLQFRSVEEPDNVQGGSIATLDFDELRRQATLLDGMASYGNVSLNVSLGDERPIRVSGIDVYGDFFEVLGVRPAAGRMLRAEETELDTDPRVAVISEELSVRLFGSSAAAVGQTLRMNEEPVTVVGVTGGGFTGAERGVHSDVWIPYGALVPLKGFTMDQLLSRNSIMHGDIVVRPRAGASREAAEAQLTDILARLAQADDESSSNLADLRPHVFPGLSVPPMGRARTNASLRTLVGIVALVLLIACANVANLLLFRNVRRQGLVATRRALGASSAHIARQYMIQSLLLAVLGTIVGLGVGWLLSLPFRGERLLRMAAFEGLMFDGRVLLFAAAVSVVTTLLFGTLPAMLAGRFDLVGALRRSGGRDTGRLSVLRSALSTGQIALGLSLVVGALLLVRTMHNLYAVDTGLDIDNVAELRLQHGADMDAAAVDALARDLVASADALPGVEGAALDLYGPHGADMMGRIGLPETPPRERQRASLVPVTPGWFEVFRVRMLSGRTFRDPDWSMASTRRVVLTASLARHLFGSTDVVGRTVVGGFATGEEMEVVGVTSDLSDARAPDRPVDAFYVTYDQTTAILPFFVLLVRVNRLDTATLQGIRGVAERLLPDQPLLSDPAPLADRVDSIHSERRIFSRLLGLLSAVAVLLTAVGLYGVVAFSVAARRREFGVRLALGAGAGRIVRLVVRHAGSILGVGLALGIAGAYALSYVLRSRLFGVDPVDPASYVAAAILFAAVAATACWIPTRAAVRVDPARTLRED